MGKINIDGEIYDYKPYIDGMYMEKLKLQIMNNPSYKQIFRKDLTNKWINSIKAIIDPKVNFQNNTIIQIYGSTGGGKSICAMSLVKQLTPNKFDYNNVCFFDNQVLEMAKDIKPNSFIIRDEGVDKAVYGVGSQRTGRQIQVLTETVRKYGLSLIFIEPELVDNGMAKWILTPIDMDINNRITRMGIMDVNTKQFMGALYIKVLPDDDIDWIKYNEIKDKFIDDLRNGKLTNSKMDYKGEAKKIYDSINHDIFNTKKKRFAYVIDKFPQITNKEIELILTYLDFFIKEELD